MGGRQKAVLVVYYKESARVGRFLLSQALWGLRSALGVSRNTVSKSHDVLHILWMRMIWHLSL